MPRMAFYPVSTTPQANPLNRAVKKKSGALTVSVEIHTSSLDTDVSSFDSGEIQGAGRRTIALSATERLSRLSAALRDADAATLWTADIELINVLADEQQSAKGDFPGPCPIVFNGESTHAPAAISAGASAVVLTANDLHLTKEVNCEIIWAVTCTDDVKRIVDDESAPEDHYLLRSEDVLDASLIASLPEGAGTSKTAPAVSRMSWQCGSLQPVPA